MPIAIVPVDSFYEWKKLGPPGQNAAGGGKLGPTEKQPYAIALADRSVMALAGLWETWRSQGQQ